MTFTKNPSALWELPGDKTLAWWCPHCGAWNEHVINEPSGVVHCLNLRCAKTLPVTEAMLNRASDPFTGARQS